MKTQKSKKLEKRLKKVIKTYSLQKTHTPLELVTIQADLQWCFQTISKQLKQSGTFNHSQFN